MSLAIDEKPLRPSAIFPAIEHRRKVRASV